MLFGLECEIKGDIKNISLKKNEKNILAVIADMMQSMVKAELGGTEFRAIAKELRISVGKLMWC